MSIQTDVRGSSVLTTTGSFYNGRARIKAVYVIGSDSAGSVVFRDGVDGTIVLTVSTPAAVVAGAHTPVYIALPENGILCQIAIHGTMTSVTNAMVIYG